MRFGIHRKLLAGFLGTLAIGAGGSAAVLDLFSRSLQRLEKAVSLNEVIAHKGFSLRFDLRGRSDALRAALAGARTDDTGGDREIAAELDQIRKLATDGDVTRLTDEVQALENRAQPLGAAIRTDAASGRRENAQARFDDEYLPLRSEQDKLATQIATRAIGLSRAARGAAGDYAAMARQLAITWVGLSLALGMTISLLLARSLSAPILKAAQAARNAAKGDLSFALRYDDRRDEIGELSRAINAALVEISTEKTEAGRIAREMEIATRIQTSILPRSLEVTGLDLAAKMRPATEVGGDYYDVIPTSNGCWIGIGDVAGHGLTAGLVMLMVQSAVSALARQMPDHRPSELLRGLNRVIFDNVRHRLNANEHVTFCLLRYWPDGRLMFAGAHEDVIVCRARTRTCETLPTPGTWLALTDDIQEITVDVSQTLEAGDLLVLYTDGVTEAMNAGGELFGLGRLCQVVAEHQSRAPREVVDAILEAVATWSVGQADDITVLVGRQGPVAATGSG